MKKKAHSCTQDHAKNVMQVELSKCKQKILSNESTSVPGIYKEFVGSLKDSGIDLIQKIPPFSKVKSGFYKSRNANFGVNKICSSKACEVEIPEKYKDFILADYCCYEDGLRIIIFGSERGKEQLCKAKHYFADGTFKSCPNPFCQLYTIHADMGSSKKYTNICPLVYALMSERTEKAYTILIQMLRSQVPNWCPKKFMTDFEFAAINAIKAEFPNIILRGCLYHYKNSLRRKGKALGLLKTKYTRRIVNLCAALPLLPKDQIKDGWTYVQQTCPPNHPKINCFMKYMSKFWLKDDKFVNQWCIFGEQYRTNNNIEGWNFSLNTSVARKNPNIVKLIEEIKKDDAYFTVKSQQLTASTSSSEASLSLLKPKEKDQILIDDWIQETQLALISGNITVGHFLETLK